MPRRSRIDAPGAIQHVIVRGIERRKIFWDPSDCDALLTRLSHLVRESGVRCYAWALLPNHFHLLLRTGKTPLPRLMRRLLTGYAVEFNRRHHRHGHLFQNRYKSILCQEEPYLLELVRYIHLNPVRNGLVDSVEALADYPYCGHGMLVGTRTGDWQATDAVLGLFGSSRHRARKRYQEFVQAGVRRGRRPELTGGGLRRSLRGWVDVEQARRETRIMSDERILGDGEFVGGVLRAAEEELVRRSALRRRYDLDRLAGEVGRICSVSPDDLFSRQRTRRLVEARSLFCYWAVEELGETGASMARRLGLTQPAVSMAVSRGRVLAKERRYRLEG